MMPNIPDKILEQAGISEQEVVLELAIRLFDTERLGLSEAGRVAGLDGVYFELELRKRKIPIWRPALEDFEDDLAALRNIGPRRSDRRY